MHIKQVIISGFRSFRSQNESESFSPKHNVVVGRNGSGKSNFFDAIQFVLLAPKFATLRPEDRQHLLHEGAGTSVMAAYVEIIFDNSDGRLSIESDEVVLRRTVGLQKDEFFLNRKRIQKSEVSSLLESAGFSKSNPYYIVQQGKVNTLCVMKDKDRLNLLKEVAGTTVYEERRTESVKIMQDTVNKQQKVEEVLAFIDDRLTELEVEKKELTEYESCDKQRRALEFNIYDKEFNKANDQLVILERQREEERLQQQDLHNDLRDAQDRAALAEETQQATREALERLAARRQAKNKELSGLSSRKSSLEVELAETESNNRTRGQETTRLQAQLKEVLRKIDRAENELASIEPAFNEKTADVQASLEEFTLVHNRIEALYGKQGRGSQFKSKAERDAFLQGQMDSINKQVSQKRKLLDKQTKDIASDDGRLQTEGAQIEAADLENRQRTARSEECARKIHECITRRNELQERRKTDWRGLEALREDILRADKELEGARLQLSRALPRHIIAGLTAVNAIVAERNLPGYFGPLIDNIDLASPNFQVAVEVAGGNSLFHIIVDTDATAALLMEELERRKAGRLTFLPLNRLRNPEIKYPDSKDVVSLMKVALSYKPEVEEAVKQVFGNKLLARDLDVATKMSKQCGLDCITKEGDLANRKGGMEGGYHDEKLSRYTAVLLIRECNERLRELREEEDRTKTQSAAADRQVEDVLRELQKLEAEKEHLRSNSHQLTRELAARAKQLQVSRATVEERRKGLAVLQQEIRVSTDQVNMYESEQQTALLQKLSDQERAELLTLEENQRVLKARVEEQEGRLREVATHKERITADLQSNLIKQRDEVTAALSSASSVLLGGDGVGTSEDIDAAVDTLRLEREHVLTLLETVRAELKEMDAQISEKNTEMVHLQEQTDRARTEEREKQESLNRLNMNLDKILNRRTTLQDTVNAQQRLIRDLGIPPAKEKEQFRSCSEKMLMMKLKEVNDHLKKYTSVNKKALDQFVSFNEQREELLQKRNEMEQDSGAIQQLIDSLDAQKDEAILRTFRGVSHFFSEVFSELVPGGNGKLIMRTTMDAANANKGSDEDTAASTQHLEDHVLADKDNDNEQNPELLAISTFQGVQVSVSFSGTGQQYQMQQLSGGQKALVALALIFAIQRCDPAPFYLFDEIDQALDANYRAGVARLIQKQVQSETAPAQFITTTFRPELVAVADKCYGITLANKVSNIHVMDKTHAADFVTNQMLEEEAVGKIGGGARPGYRRGGAQQQDEEETRSEADSTHGDDLFAGAEDEDDEPRSPVKKSRSAAARGKTSPAVSTPVKRGATRSSRGTAASASSRRDSAVSSIQSSLTGGDEGDEDIDVDDDFFNQIGDDLMQGDDDEDYKA